MLLKTKLQHSPDTHIFQTCWTHAVVLMDEQFDEIRRDARPNEEFAYQPDFTLALGTLAGLTFSVTVQ